VGYLGNPTINDQRLRGCARHSHTYTTWFAPPGVCTLPALEGSCLETVSCQRVNDNQIPRFRLERANAFSPEVKRVAVNRSHFARDNSTAVSSAPIAKAQ